MPFIYRLQPPLTSVRVPQYELGVEAARLLLDRLSGRTVTPRVVLLPVRLVVRGSTAPPPAEHLPGQPPKPVEGRVVGRDQDDVGMAGEPGTALVQRERRRGVSPERCCGPPGPRLRG